MSPFEMWGSLISDATARLSMPVDCISRKKEECSSLCSLARPICPSRLVLSTSRRSAGTLCPLKPAQKSRLIKQKQLSPFNKGQIPRW